MIFIELDNVNKIKVFNNVFSLITIIETLLKQIYLQP